MIAKDVIRQTLDMGESIVRTYVNDLEDADLRLRPAGGMNPIAWQLGHLLAYERMMVEGIKPDSSPPLPDGFEAAHAPEAAKSDDFAGLKTKAEYLKLWRAQRAATKAVLDGLSDAELDSPAPERFRQMWPTVGAVLTLVGNHTLMHVGQFIPVRRKLGKPVLI